MCPSKPVYHEGVRSKEYILETIPEHKQLADTETDEQKRAKGYTLMQCHCAPYTPQPCKPKPWNPSYCDRVKKYQKRHEQEFKRRHEHSCAVVC